MSLTGRIRADAAFVLGVGRLLRLVTPMAWRKHRTVSDALEDLAHRHGERPALLSDGETLTFASLNRRANRYGRWALASGIGKGDVVGLLMPNRPEYPAIWLGIARVGGVVALLDARLGGTALAACIDMVAPRHVIVADELRDTLDSALPHLSARPRTWLHGGTGGDPQRVDAVIETLDDGPIPRAERPPLSLEDRCLYVFTSGTAGLPKPAVASHYRVYGAMLAFSAVMEARPADRLYNCLPLHHMAGGVIGIGACLMAGGSVFIGRGYSESRFWDEVADNRCSIVQYTGEMGRMLVKAAAHPKERSHRLRLACGSGLRPGVWEAFTRRFAVPRVREFYGATEGNALIFNWDHAPGKVGRIPDWARLSFPVTTVRIDLERAAPIRGVDGLCVECAPGEVGEVVSRIVVDPLKPAQRFDGFVDRIETERQILRDVFVAGDMWFRSGDLMRRDERGYFVFVDRVSDAFRRHGRPVWTAEVADALVAHPGVRAASVYGVPAPRDGLSVMAAIVPAEGLDLGDLRRHLHEALPSHARPAFLRLQEHPDMTSTFRQRKPRLVAEGFDPARADGPVFFDDPAAGGFVRVDAALYRRLGGGAEV